MSFQRLKLMRAAARVKRCHAMHCNHVQTDGEHTFGVLCLIQEIVAPRIPSAQLLTAALYHDSTEAVRGDPPAPVMRHPDLKRGYENLDDELNEKFGLVVKLSDWETDVLRFCDSMEFAMYALEEVASGNRIFMPRVRYVLASIKRRELHNITVGAKNLTTVMELRAAEYPENYGEDELHGYPG